jgi:YVTN family beta-propeller protein
VEEEVRLGSEMAEFRKEITIGSTLAIILVLVLASAVVYLPLGLSSKSSSSSSGSKVATATLVTCASNSFVEGATNCEARVSGDPPSGNVSWAQVSGTGKATFTPSTCILYAGACGVTITQGEAGSVGIAASYGGDSSNRPSTGQLSIPTGFPTFDVAVNPRTNVVFGVDDAKNRLIAINETDGSVIGNVSVGGPGRIAVNPLTNMIYVVTNSVVTNSVVVVNGTSFTVAANISLGESPVEVAVNTATNLVYVTSPGPNVWVINGSTNMVITSIPLTSGVQSSGGLAVDPVTNTVYVADCASGNVSVISGSDNQVVSRIKVGNCPNGVSVNPYTGRVYVADYNLNDSSVSVIDASTNAVVGAIHAGGSPYGIAVDTATDLVYLTYLSPASVVVVDGATNAVKAKVQLGGTPFEVAVNPVTDLIYVSNYNFYAIQIIDGRTNALVGEPVISVAGACVSATNGCISGSAFSLTLANNGTVTIKPTTIGITVSENRGGSYIYATFSLSTTSSIVPTGPAQTIMLPSWSTVGNKTGSFSPGDTVDLLVCLPIGPCSSGQAVVSA